MIMFITACLGVIVNITMGNQYKRGHSLFLSVLHELQK